MTSFNCCHCFNAVDKADPNTKCDSCHLVIHIRCLNLSAEESTLFSRVRSANIKIFCNRCNANINLFNDLKQSIAELKSSFEGKLNALENLVTSRSSQVQSENQEDIIVESVERMSRASNILLVGIPESSVPDVEIVNNILKVIDPGVMVSTSNIFRLGTSSSRPRLIKVKLPDQITTRNVLKRKSALMNTSFSKINIRADLTPKQQQQLSMVRAELRRRIEGGEQDITIKYVKGTPIIVNVKDNNQPKNLNREKSIFSPVNSPNLN